MSVNARKSSIVVVIMRAAARYACSKMIRFANSSSILTPLIDVCLLNNSFFKLTWNDRSISTEDTTAELNDKILAA